MTDEHGSVTPEDYKTIFEDHRTGQKIYEDLIIRFGGIKKQSAGIDRVLDTFEYSGRRQVIEYITHRINQANGVEPESTIQLEE